MARGYHQGQRSCTTAPTDPMTVARAGYAAGHPKLEDHWMSQPIATLIPAAVDYERTLVLAIELSNKS